MLTNTTDVILHGNGSLVLHNVGPEDSGNYACIAENGDLSIMTDAQVNVNSKLNICPITTQKFTFLCFVTTPTKNLMTLITRPRFPPPG